MRPWYASKHEWMAGCMDEWSAIDNGTGPWMPIAGELFVGTSIEQRHPQNIRAAYITHAYAAAHFMSDASPLISTSVLKYTPPPKRCKLLTPPAPCPLSVLGPLPSRNILGPLPNRNIRGPLPVSYSRPVTQYHISPQHHTLIKKK